MCALLDFIQPRASPPPPPRPVLSLKQALAPRPLPPAGTSYKEPGHTLLSLPPSSSALASDLMTYTRSPPSLNWKDQQRVKDGNPSPSSHLYSAFNEARGASIYFSAASTRRLSSSQNSGALTLPPSLPPSLGTSGQAKPKKQDRQGSQPLGAQTKSTSRRKRRRRGKLSSRKIQPQEAKQERGAGRQTDRLEGRAKPTSVPTGGEEK